MQDHTTFPALLATETVPVPLTMASPLTSQQTTVPAPKVHWLSVAGVGLALALLVWLSRRWW